MVKITVKLTSPISHIKLNQIYKATKLRINQYYFVTAQNDIRYFVVRVSGWTQENSLYDSSNSAVEMPITKYMPVIHKQDAALIYENTSARYDVERDEPTIFGNNSIEILVDGNYNSTAVSPSFPIFLEFEIE
jgi:hypothetical protein